MPTDIERDSLILHVSPEHERQCQCHQPQLSVSTQHQPLGPTAT
jgi:hypothetical protein